MPSISFCMTTRGALPRVHGLLALVRPYVDEIVLAVDGKGNLDVLDACADLADRQVTFEYAPPPCRMIGWLQHQCSADWLLRLDDDEIPSRALLDALPELTADRRPTHYGLTRRWLYGDAETWLLSPPWHPDYQLRLVRNVPGIWRFTGLMHDGAIVLGERRLADLPIYHADLLLLDVDARRRKAEVYERLRPDHMAEGVPVNAIYAPEDWESLVTEPVPAEDRDTISSVLRAPPSPPPSGREVSVPSFTAADIDAFNTTRSIGDGAYRARIELVRPVTRMPVGMTREQEVVVENMGEERWPWGPDAEPPIRLGYRWRRYGDVVAEGPRTPFTETVVPGARTLVKLVVDAPASPGDHVLEIDVVHEHVRWFDCGATLEVRVEDVAPTGPRRLGAMRAYVDQARAHAMPIAPALRHYRRWSAALDPERTPLADGRPWLTFGAQRVLEDTLRADMRACEFGAGGSTLYLLERTAALTTIEWDRAWAASVRDAVRPGRRDAWRLEVVEPQVDPAGRRLDPSDPESCVSASPAFVNHSFRAYVQAIDRFDDEAFDVVLVAGRARPSALRHALSKLRPDGLLVLDHAERPWYGPALALPDPADWTREDHAGPGPYAERFWTTTVYRGRGRRPAA